MLGLNRLHLPIQMAFTLLQMSKAMMGRQEVMHLPKGRKRHRLPPLLKTVQMWICILLHPPQARSPAYRTLQSLKLMAKRRHPWRTAIYLVQQPKHHSRSSRLLQRSHRNFVLALPLKVTRTPHRLLNRHPIPRHPCPISPMYSSHHPHQSRLLSRVVRHPLQRVWPSQTPFQKLAQVLNRIR